ncbi:MAG: DMT family transporter [OCS116 cluster bacterium]|nr:DMT family transporter [OCS116 cluster bacterium]
MANSSIPKSISAPTAADIVLILLCALIWASAFTGIKVAVAHFEPIMVAFSRVLIGFVFLFVYVLLQPAFKRQTSWPTGRANWVRLCIIAILYTAVPFSLISWGQQYVSASLTSIIMGSSPLIGFIIAHFATHDEKLNKYKLIALGFGLLGVYLAVDFTNNTDSQSHLWGIVAIFAALVCYSVSGLITRRLTNGSTENISASVLGLGTIFLIPALFISGQYPNDIMNSDSVGIWALIYLGLFPTGLAYLIRFHLILKIGFTAFLTSIFFIPIFGVFLSAFLLGEPLTLKIFFALSILVASLFISRLGNRKN